MSQPTWPIRVGGIYKATNHAFSCRVTAIDDENVYSLLRSYHGHTGETSEHNPQVDKHWLFRTLYSPEDSSPISELVEALEACDTAFAGWQYGQIPGRPEDILALTQKVRAALHKAGAR